MIHIILLRWCYYIAMSSSLVLRHLGRHCLSNGEGSIHLSLSLSLHIHIYTYIYIYIHNIYAYTYTNAAGLIRPHLFSTASPV